MHSSNALQFKIQEAWQLRFQRRMNACETAVQECENLAPAADLDMQLQIRLLKASLVRAQGDHAGSKHRLEEIKIFASQEKCRLPFQYYFQCALNVTLEDQFAVALDFFSKALASSTTDEERALSLVNILNCLENLNLPWETTLAQLERLAKKSVFSNYDEAVRVHLAAFRQRQVFRNGHLKSYFQIELPETFGQVHFHRLWVAHLPYVRTKPAWTKPVAIDLGRLALETDFFTRDYRLQTLRPQLDPSVAKSGDIEVRHQVDRLYLWVWQWLKNPGLRERENLRSCLEAFDFAGALGRMTYEDYQMLRNALRWLALLQPRLSAEMNGYLARFKINDVQAFPLFDFESRWIDWLEAKKRGEPGSFFYKRIKDHPLFDSKDLRFQEFAECWLKEFLNQSSKPIERNKLTIDVTHHRLRLRGQEVVSEPLTLLLKTLYQREVLDFSETLSICFGISPYNEDIHRAKIHNLVARAKTLLPRGTDLKTKNQKIYLKGRIDFLRLEQPGPHEQDLKIRHLRGLRGTARRSFGRQMHPRNLVEKSQGQKEFTRQELQEKLNLSKASVVRWLLKWQRQGLIHSQGRGKSIKYIFEIP